MSIASWVRAFPPLAHKNMHGWAGGLLEMQCHVSNSYTKCPEFVHSALKLRRVS